MKIILFSVFLVLLISCGKNKSTKDKDLKSPCVSNDNGPCSNRINPNYSWMPKVG